MGRLSDWLRGKKPAAPPPTADGPSRRIPFTLKYGYFRELLAANDRVLEVIADVEDRLGGEIVFGMDELRARLESASLAAFVIAKNLNLISAGRYPGLYDALEAIDRRLVAAIGQGRRAAAGALVVPLSGATAGDVDALGAKMANLGEVRNRLGLRVPDGFVVTTDAHELLVAHDGLAETIVARLALTGADPRELESASEAVRALLLCAEMPPALAAALAAAADDLARRTGRVPRLAVRSSAVGEDGASSFAGQYQTLLNVSAGDLPSSVLRVVASLFNPGAIAYRRQRGLRDEGTRMAVGCIEMVDATAAGVLLTRDPARPDERRVIVEAFPGQGVTVVAGTATPDRFVLDPGPPARIVERSVADKRRMRVPASWGGLAEVDVPGERQRAACVTDEQLVELAGIAGRLEQHFGAPQDVEWAIDAAGAVFVLQARPLAFPRAAVTLPAAALEGHEVLVGDGTPACPGVAHGPIVRVEGSRELDGVPAGAVLVARHTAPGFVRVMGRVAAIVTEVGSTTGHMAIIARELGVPTLLGATGATALPAGLEVTVDASRGRVYRGRVEPLLSAAQPERRAPMKGTPVFQVLERVAPEITPLSLVDPASDGFRPEACRSLHDIIRFAHEKTFVEMFHFGDDVKRADEAQARKLRARLPIEVYVFDLGGALQTGVDDKREIDVEDVVSVPLKAFIAGLADPAIRWDRPRPVSLGGFLSVLGESMVSPPPSKHGLGRRSFAMASDTYLNFSTRAGYHFSTLDTVCGRSINKNYVQFRFNGGAASAERRARRVRFVGRVLEQHGFETQVKRDLVTARMSKYEREAIEGILRTLGRLTICARQLDMLMDSDAAVDAFVEAFTAGRYDRFA